MNLFRRFKIWRWNRQSKRLIDEYAFWLVQVDMRKMGLAPGLVEDAKKAKNAIKQKLDDLHLKRNQYACLHNIKPHPNAPDNWKLQCN